MSVNRATATLLRSQSSPYTTVPSLTVNLIKDGMALAIYIYLQTKPDYWIIRATEVQNHFGIGRDKYQKSCRYLRDLGLLETLILRDAVGKVTDNRVVINYEPNPEALKIRLSAKKKAKASDSNGSSRSPEKPTVGKSGPLVTKGFISNLKNNNNTREPEIKKPMAAEWEPDTEILKTKLEPHADIKKLLADKKTYRVALNEFKTNQIESYGHIKKTPAGWVTSFVARLLACKRVDASNAPFLNYPELRSTQASVSHTAKKPTIEKHGSSAYKEFPSKPILKTGTQAEREKTKADAKLAGKNAMSGLLGR